MDIVTRLLWGWDARIHAPDQLGKVFVVTGANSGLGYETTLRLAERNALVVMAVRNTESGNRAAEAIRYQVRGAKLLVWHVNMASFRSVRAFASRVAASFPSGIHGLVNNAGVLNAPVSGAAATSENGIEVTRAVDYFGPVLLTHLLLPSLAVAAPSRVVSVSSLGEALGALDWGDLRGLNSPASTFRAYGCAKLMLLMWTRELNRRLRGTGIDCFAVHPAVV
ncbi:Retinol dehydrogenase 13 [Monoraphidium neglectum]|uniref:Retinol dehydrogenase 13 n=1 Tax=Monoraphidium neglectum TaxID=145388 RepID=A0A0D2KJ40_9CHLO|nr:Retinol dehydrogenase 13 [Monoraphidium neglectum]KIY95843.1 Retinol dehydrogenase 13 [Monoraphidium neglectum]|eukprot:XP_013894863.1 Retinol dehydrogenase 13 [Monoraphidium neglectum]